MFKNILLDVSLLIEDVRVITDYIYEAVYYYVFGASKNEQHNISCPTDIAWEKPFWHYAGKEEVDMGKKNAATKAWETRRALAAKRSAAAKKAWATRRKMAKKTK